MEETWIDEEKSLLIEEEVVALLRKTGLKVTFAESCTGGLLAGRLVNVSGASEVFKCSVVTYSNKAKRKLLGVNKCTLKVFGAVSSQTAVEMSMGALRHLAGDVAVSVTGIAGPGGGTDKKPVGLVYIACNLLGHVTVREYHFKGERLDVRTASVQAALELLKERLEQYLEERNK